MGHKQIDLMKAEMTVPGCEVAYIVYFLKKRHLIGELRLEIRDAAGALVATLPAGKRRGINRVEWTMRQPGPKFPPGEGIIASQGAFRGPRAPEGTYTATLVKGQDTFQAPIQLVADPRSRASAEDKALQHRTIWALHREIERLAALVARITGLRGQAQARALALPAGDGLRRQLEALGRTLDRQREALVSSQEGEGISGEQKLREELGMLYGNVNSYEGRPTASQLQRMETLRAQDDAAHAAYEAVIRDLSRLNAMLAKRKLDALSSE